MRHQPRAQIAFQVQNGEVPRRTLRTQWIFRQF